MFVINLAAMAAAMLGPEVTRASPPSPPAMALFPKDEVPGERPGAIGPEKDLNDTVGHIYNVTIPTITPYLASNPSASAGVIIAPGGGYATLAYHLEGIDIANWLNSIGVHAFLLKYRVPARKWLPFGQAPLIDAQRAVGLVRSKAASLGANITNGLGFMGFSAGGHLTGHLSATAGSKPHARAYARIDDADDYSCRPDFSIMVYPWCLTGAIGDCQQDINHTVNVPVSSHNPPAFLVQAEDDPVHAENSIFYFLSLKQNKAPPSELHVYPKGGHGYGRTKCKGEEVCEWPDRAATFLRTLGVAPKTVAAEEASRACHT